jgi:hypothetical protein
VTLPAITPTSSFPAATRSAESRSVLAVVRRTLSALKAPLAVAAAGLAAEYALRKLVNRGMAALVRNARPEPLAALARVPSARRIVITEFVVREQVRRFR